MKNKILVAVFAVISISMISCSYDENEIQTKQNLQIHELDSNLNSKEGDSLTEGDPILPRPKG
jgi:hypothetical protein